MADVAFIFHWSLSELESLEIEELSYWRSAAIERWNAANSTDGDDR